MSEIDEKTMADIHQCVNFYISSLNGCRIKHKETNKELLVTAVQTSRGRVFCQDEETKEDVELGGFDVINNYKTIAEREK